MQKTFDKHLITLKKLIKAALNSRSIKSTMQLLYFSWGWGSINLSHVGFVELCGIILIDGNDMLADIWINTWKDVITAKRNLMNVSVEFNLIFCDIRSLDWLFVVRDSLMHIYLEIYVESQYCIQTFSAAVLLKVTNHAQSISELNCVLSRFVVWSSIWSTVWWTSAWRFMQRVMIAFKRLVQQSCWRY